MHPNWLKHPSQTYWSARYGPFDLSVIGTIYGFSYLVYRKPTLKAGNVKDLDLAQATALRLAQELGA